MYVRSGEPRHMYKIRFWPFNFVLGYQHFFPKHAAEDITGILHTMLRLLPETRQMCTRRRPSISPLAKWDRPPSIEDHFESVRKIGTQTRPTIILNAPPKSPSPSPPFLNPSPCECSC